jgi:hypothetical protein
MLTNLVVNNAIGNHYIPQSYVFPDTSRSPNENELAWIPASYEVPCQGRSMKPPIGRQQDGENSGSPLSSRPVTPNCGKLFVNDYAPSETLAQESIKFKT